MARAQQGVIYRVGTKRTPPVAKVRCEGRMDVPHRGHSLSWKREPTWICRLVAKIFGGVPIDVPVL